MKCYNQWLQPHHLERSEISFLKIKSQLLTEKVKLPANQLCFFNARVSSVKEFSVFLLIPASFLQKVPSLQASYKWCVIFLVFVLKGGLKYYSLFLTYNAAPVKRK